MYVFTQTIQKKTDTESGRTTGSKYARVLTDNRPKTILQRKYNSDHAATLVQGNGNKIIQGQFIAVIGEESAEHPTTLHDGAMDLVRRYGEKKYYTENEIDSGDFRTPAADETIYLIAHGDNPAISLTTQAALGGKSGTQVKNIVKKILQQFKTKNKGEQFSGRIILEGCHTAEPVIGEDGKMAGGSMLHDVQEAMMGDKFFKTNMAPEASIGGYMGQAFSAGDYTHGYGTANTEHPLTIRYQKSVGKKGERQTDGSIGYDETESFLESRWKKKLPFGSPGK